MRFNKIVFLIIIGIVSLGLFGCSEGTTDYSPEEVINNALEDSNLPASFYGESETITKENGEIINEMTMKEWRTDEGMVRIEMENKDGSESSIVVNDGNAITTYMAEENKAMIIDDPELLTMKQPSPKEQAEMLLETVRDTHDVSVEGEEDIAGRATYHIVATPKEKNTLFGKQELWVDKETWTVLKMTFNTGDTEAEIVYNKVDYKKEITPEQFELELPEDVQIETMDDMEDMNETISLDEVTKAIGKEVLYIPESEEMQLSEVGKTELKGELQRTEINMEYEQDDLPLLSISVFETPEDLEEEELTLPGEEAIEIRGQNGSMMDAEELQIISWQEDGLSYSVILLDPEFTIEAFLELADDMEHLE